MVVRRLGYVDGRGDQWAKKKERASMGIYPKLQVGWSHMQQSLLSLFSMGAVHNSAPK